MKVSGNVLGYDTIFPLKHSGTQCGTSWHKGVECMSVLPVNS